MKMQRSRAFFAGPYRSHRRLLQLTGGKKLHAFRSMAHLTAARVRSLVTRLRLNRAEPNPAKHNPLDPLLRGSRRDPNRATYRGMLCRTLPTPFHHFGTAAFDAKRDFRWLAQEVKELDMRTKTREKVWRVMKAEKGLHNQMKLLRWHRNRRSRRSPFIRFFSKVFKSPPGTHVPFGAETDDEEEAGGKTAKPVVSPKNQHSQGNSAKKQPQPSQTSPKSQSFWEKFLGKTVNPPPQPPTPKSWVKPSGRFFPRRQIQRPRFLHHASFLDEMGNLLKQDSKPTHRNSSVYGYLNQIVPLDPSPPSQARSPQWPTVRQQRFSGGGSAAVRSWQAAKH